MNQLHWPMAPVQGSAAPADDIQIPVSNIVVSPMSKRASAKCAGV